MSISGALLSRLQLSKRMALGVVLAGVVVLSLAGPNRSSAADAVPPDQPPADRSEQTPCCKPLGPACDAAKQGECRLPTAINALDTPAEGQSRERIEKALESPTEIEFIEAPLSDVVDYLKRYHAIEIQIDAKALSDVGITPDERITKDLKGISLRAALRLMLRDLDLTYFICDEVLLITTPEEAGGRLTVRLYPVGDLLAAGDSQGAYPADGKALIEMITSTLFPSTWETAGGPSSIRGVSFGGVDTLVVTQTDEVHRQIAALLENLRRVAASNR